MSGTNIRQSATDEQLKAVPSPNKGDLRIKVEGLYRYNVCGAEISIKEAEIFLSSDNSGSCSCRLPAGTYTVSFRMNRTGFGETKKITVFENEKSTIFFAVPED
jgi:hypothetical protein